MRYAGLLQPWDHRPGQPQVSVRVLLPAGESRGTDPGEHNVPVVGQHEVTAKALVQEFFQVVGHLLPLGQVGAAKGVVYIPAQPHTQLGQLPVVILVQGVVDMADVDVVRLPPPLLRYSLAFSPPGAGEGCES